MTERQPVKNPMRLNKFIALSLGVSRRKADELIEQGEILVNGKRAVLGRQISQSDTILHNSQELHIQPKKLILLHKPVGYLCSRASQGGVPTASIT